MKSQRILLSIAVLGLLIGCTSVGVSPQSRYQVTERFRARPGGVDVTGVRVVSTLPAERLSQAQLERLGSFLSDGLRKTTIGAVVNLNGREAGEASPVDEEAEKQRDRGVAYVVTVDVTMFEVATPQQKQGRVPSQLRGNISVRNVHNDRALGRAIIWARGSGLDLEANYTPDTVREFYVAMRQLMR